jgi:hypothetical protein
MKNVFALLGVLLIFCCCAPDAPAEASDNTSGQAMLDSLDATYLKVKPATYMLVHPEKDSLSSYLYFTNKTIDCRIFVCVIEISDDGSPDKRLFMTVVEPKKSELFVLQKIRGATLKIVDCYLPAPVPMTGRNDTLSDTTVFRAVRKNTVTIDTLEVSPHQPLRLYKNYFNDPKSGT